MKDKDVRIGMKVTVQGIEDVCIVVYEKDYKTKNGNVYTLQNEKTGKKMTLNACDFEPYIDIDLTAEQLRKDIDKIKEALSQHLLIDFVAKNKDTFEKLVEESKEEKLEKEIMEAFDEYTNKECSYSLQTCFRAGFLAGRESK
jgi:topoisomerase IA-like protein